MIEVMFAVRKDDFKDYPICLKELDLVDESEQYTHFLSIEDIDTDVQSGLNIFKYDENYEENEEKYKILKREILDETSSSEEDDESGDGDDEDDEENDDDEEEKKQLKKK